MAMRAENGERVEVIPLVEEITPELKALAAARRQADAAGCAPNSKPRKSP